MLTLNATNRFTASLMVNVSAMVSDSATISSVKVLIASVKTNWSDTLAVKISKDCSIAS